MSTPTDNTPAVSKADTTKKSESQVNTPNPADPASDAASFVTLVSSDTGSTTTLVPPSKKDTKRGTTRQQPKDYEAAMANLISTYGFEGRAPIMSVPNPGLGTSAGADIRGGLASSSSRIRSGTANNKGEGSKDKKASKSKK